MSELTTSKGINVSQLCAEMGGTPLHVVGPESDGMTVVRADVSQEALNAAVSRHVADPSWSPPPDPLIVAQQQERKRLEELAAKEVLLPKEAQEFRLLLVERMKNGG